MKPYALGLCLGLLLGAVVFAASVATAQTPTRLYGTYNTKPIPLAATSAGYLSATGTP